MLLWCCLDFWVDEDEDDEEVMGESTSPTGDPFAVGTTSIVPFLSGRYSVSVLGCAPLG